MKWEIKAQGEPAGEADIYINDFIGDWIDSHWDFGVTSKGFLDELNRLPESIKNVRLHITSPGGDVSAANHIANIIRDQQTTKGRTFEALIEGAAWSAATIITSACNPTRIADNGLMMIHNPWTIVLGDAAELRKQADVMDKFRDSIVAAYQWKTPLEEKEIIEMMDSEFWMDADEAIEFGFADSKIEGFRAAAALDAAMLAKAPKIPEEYQERVNALIKPAPTAVVIPVAAAPDAGAIAAKIIEDTRAAALEITELCKAAGVADQAGDFLAGGKTPDEVRERLKDAGEIRSACVAARLPDRANRYIKAGFALDEVRADLLEILKARDIDIDNKLPTTERSAALPSLNVSAIYARLRQPLFAKK